MVIAICQIEIRFENKKENQMKVIRFLNEAKSKNAELALFPEMTLTGFSMDIDKTAENNGYTVDFFKKMAKEEKLKIGFGWVYRRTEKAENHYTIVNENGETINDYIKIHPFSHAGEDIKFIAGDSVLNFMINDICMSTFICYDLRFPEIFQISSREAHVIIVPANWPALRSEQWQCLLRARAIENQVYIIGINCVGSQDSLSYSGDSYIINPNGEIVLSGSNREEIVLYNFEDDVDEYKKRFSFKQDRNSELYKKYL